MENIFDEKFIQIGAVVVKFYQLKKICRQKYSIFSFFAVEIAQNVFQVR